MVRAPRGSRHFVPERDGNLCLVPGDSPTGFRPPRDALPYVYGPRSRPWHASRAPAGLRGGYRLSGCAPGWPRDGSQFDSAECQEARLRSMQTPIYWASWPIIGRSRKTRSSGSFIFSALTALKMPGHPARRETPNTSAFPYVPRGDAVVLRLALHMGANESN
jgi:hypothetical protein